MARTRTTPTASLKSKDTPPEARKVLASIGLFSRVAAKVGVSPGHARLVARGERKSKRVLDAIVAEVRRIEREIGRAA